MTADAWVGEYVGELLNSENTAIRVPTLLPEGEGHIYRRVIASCERALRSLRTWHAWKPHARKSGGPSWTLHSYRMHGWAGEGEMPYGQLKIHLGSRTQHSTVEASEQGEISTSAELVEGRT